MAASRSALQAALVAAALMLPGGFAHAHELRAFAAIEDGVIHARVTYGDGSPVKGAAITVRGPNNETFASLESDADGRAEFRVERPVQHTVIAETPDGHRAELVVPADQLNAVAPHAPDDLDARIARAVAKELRPLREQLDQYERTIRYRDVLGGIGFIIGIGGAVALVKAAKKERP